MTLELTRGDYELILMALGYGTGAASLKGDLQGFRMGITAANALGKAGGCNFRPYDLEAEVVAFEGKRHPTREEPTKP